MFDTLFSVIKKYSSIMSATKIQDGDKKVKIPCSELASINYTIGFCSSHSTTASDYCHNFFLNFVHFCFFIIKFQTTHNIGKVMFSMQNVIEIVRISNDFYYCRQQLRKKTQHIPKRKTLLKKEETAIAIIFPLGTMQVKQPSFYPVNLYFKQL